MTTTLVGLVIGALVAAWSWHAGAPMFDTDVLRRTNHRGAPVVTGVGVLVVLTTVVVVAAGRIVVLLVPDSPRWDGLATTAVVAAAGFGVLGLFDDVAGVGQSGGFRGHLRALRAGHLTSGMVKLVGGAAVGVVVAGAVAAGVGGPVRALRDGAVVALTANLANLFDRAPGRVTKVTTLSFLAAAVVAASPTLAAPAVAIGAGVGLLRADLREQMMLGDVGANVLGAVCGLAWLVALPGALGRWALLAVLVVANVASEFVSFSRVIDAVPPLRWFDRLGRLPA